MSSKNNETQELDKKKAQLISGSKNKSNILKNISSFIITLLITIIIIIGYVIFGSIILYECKLAQSNIIPTILECYPYTNNNLDIEKINSNIFITDTEPPKSSKINFPYDKFNSNNTILEMFRKYKEKPTSYFLLNYIIAILESLINYNNNALNTFFNFLNQIPEILIVTIGPILSLIYFGLVQIMGLFMFIFYYFSEMKWFFKENINTNSNGKPEWKDVGLLNPFKISIAIILVICFFILFWILLFTISPVLVISIFYICLFMTFSYKFDFNDKSATLVTIIKETFKFYKTIITTIISILIILMTFSNLGSISGVITLLTIMLIYFKIININIFDSIQSINITPLTSFDQAIKNCSNTVKPKTFFNTIGNFFESKGGGINYELKKLNKKLQK